MIQREIFLSYTFSFLLNFTLFVFSFNFFNLGELKKNSGNSFTLTLDTNKYHINAKTERNIENYRENNSKIKDITEEQRLIQINNETNNAILSTKKNLEKKNLIQNTKDALKKDLINIENKLEIKKDSIINTNRDIHEANFIENIVKNDNLIMNDNLQNDLSSNRSNIRESVTNEEMSLVAGIGKNIQPKEYKFGETNGPNFREKVEPIYPIKARRLGKEGIVKVKLHIDEEGKLIDIIFLEDPGYGFKESVLQALQRSTFTPASENGRPIPSIALLTISFKLED